MFISCAKFRSLKKRRVFSHSNCHASVNMVSKSPVGLKSVRSPFNSWWISLWTHWIISTVSLLVWGPRHRPLPHGRCHGQTTTKWSRYVGPGQPLSGARFNDENRRKCHWRSRQVATYEIWPIKARKTWSIWIYIWMMYSCTPLCHSYTYYI